ncbi:MAG: cystathionine beta-lyase [Robiginitomaculum sp.]|nr:MAG: cystathionine beta-lyase [Robiginitomaculum sp.]
MKKSTLFSHVGRPKIGRGTSVNPSVTHASTLLFEKADDLYNGNHRIYGRHGSEVHDALKEAFCALEDGAGCTLTPSGLAANALSILANVKAGDHILVSDSSYGPVRKFCDNHLVKFGVETEYFPPRLGKDIESLIRDNTSCLILESPGSLTLEIQDLPAIVKVAKKAGIITIVDNTWSAGLVYNPLNLGADIAVHAATKYYSGHSDVLFGAIISRTKELAAKVHATNIHLGNSTSPDDAYTILRGFRTITTRFERQEKTALTLAQWLQSHAKVDEVLHPALSTHPDHDIWKRDFTGSACLFSVVLKPCSQAQVLKFLDSLKYFAKGFSFGGYESLIIHCDPQLKRSHSDGFAGPLIRIACGLEDITDLQLDLEQGLATLSLDDNVA